MDDLYLAIAADPDDPAPRLVLADLLQSEGDPRGTLIAAQYAVECDPDNVAMRVAVARVFRKSPDLVPTASGIRDPAELLDLRWRQGFVDRMSARLPRWLHFDPEGPSLEETVVELLQHPSCRFLRHLVLLHARDVPDFVLDRAREVAPLLQTVATAARVDEDWFIAAVDEDPAAVRWAAIRSEESLDHLGAHASRLVNLEVLSISGGHRVLPDGIGDLPALRRLSVDWCGRLESLPDGLLANPSFVHLSMYDCAGLQAAGYEMVRVNQTLAGWERVHASRGQRAVELALLLGREESAGETATDEDLIRALDSNMAAIRTAAIRVLSERFPPRTVAGDVVIAGSFDLKRAELKALLTDAGATARTKITGSTKAVLVGQSPKGLGLEALRRGLPLLLERDVLSLRDAPEAQADPSLQSALRSRDPGRTAAALDALALGVLDDALIAEVLAVAHDTEMSKPVRAAAKKLFAIAASEALQRAAAAQFKQSPLVSGEKKRVGRIRAVENAAPEFDGLTFSIALCEREGCAWTLIFERADAAEIRRLLTVQIREGTLDLGGTDLDRFPEVLADLPVVRLSLNYLHLEEVPAVVGRMTGLRELDLSENRFTELPDLSRLTVLEKLDLSENRFTELPERLRSMPGLRTLDLSAESLEGAHLRELPEWVGELQTLRDLELRSHAFAALPDGLFLLSAMRRLSLMGCRLPPPDARVAGWSGLDELEVSNSDWDAHVKALAAWLPQTRIVAR